MAVLMSQSQLHSDGRREANLSHDPRDVGRTLSILPHGTDFKSLKESPTELNYDEAPMTAYI